MPSIGHLIFRTKNQNADHSQVIEINTIQSEVYVIPTQHEVADSSKCQQVGDVFIIFDSMKPDFVGLE